MERFVAGARTSAGLTGRSHWLAETSERAPRELLEAQGLSQLLIGYSGGGEFLLVLPEPIIPKAEEHLGGLRARVAASTAGAVDVVWATTENLGPWPAIWKRLRDGLRARRQAPLAQAGLAAFSPASPSEPDIPLTAGTPEALAKSANGRRAWGVLRCDIDHTAARLALAETDEAFRYLAVLYKGVVAGELDRIAAMPEHTGRVQVIYSGGDDFAVAGAWDALLGVATEFHRVFRIFAGQLPGGDAISDGSTVSAALTLAEAGESLPGVWRRNGAALEAAKSSGRNSIAIFGRILDWPALKDAEALKARMRKLRDSYRCPPEVFAELEDFYGVRGAAGELASVRARRRERAVDKPWRFHGRLRRLARDRGGPDFERQWRAFMEDLLGRGASQKQLRPAGKAALDWARLESGWRG